MFSKHAVLLKKTIHKAMESRCRGNCDEQNLLAQTRVGKTFNDVLERGHHAQSWAHQIWQHSGTGVWYVLSCCCKDV